MDSEAAVRSAPPAATAEVLLEAVANARMAEVIAMGSLQEARTYLGERQRAWKSAQERDPAGDAGAEAVHRLPGRDRPAGYPRGRVVMRVEMPDPDVVGPCDVLVAAPVQRVQLARLGPAGAVAASCRLLLERPEETDRSGMAGPGPGHGRLPPA